MSWARSWPSTKRFTLVPPDNPQQNTRSSVFTQPRPIANVTTQRPPARATQVGTRRAKEFGPILAFPVAAARLLEVGRPSSDQWERLPRGHRKTLRRALISAGVRRRFGDLTQAQVSCRRRAILVRSSVWAHDRRRRWPGRAVLAPRGRSLASRTLCRSSAARRAEGLQCVPGPRGPDERMQGAPPMNILLFSMPDSFEHMPTIAIRMPNGALTSLAGNVDPHHRLAAADLLLVQNRSERPSSGS